MLEGMLLLALASGVNALFGGCVDPDALEFAHAKGHEAGRFVACAPIPGGDTTITAFDRSERNAGIVEVWLHSGTRAIASHVIKDPEWLLNGNLRGIGVGTFPGLLRDGGDAISVTIETSLNSWDPERSVWVLVQSGDLLIPALSES
jgi:hypothetical protein